LPSQIDKISIVSLFIEIYSSSLNGALCLGQGSTTFLKLRATSCIPINAKGNYFDTHTWNKNFVQFTFNYFSIDIR